ncbi:MAG: hypothetical protein C5B51_22770, partial [Terriglobia bacterium]
GSDRVHENSGGKDCRRYKGRRTVSESGSIPIVGAVLAGLLACPWAFALNPDLDVSQYGHFSWKYRDGFAKGTVQSIAQTQDGYLWLATSTSGLLRFDGVTTAQWEPPPGQSLPSNDVLHLLCTRDGTLWISTINGLASWKNGRLTPIPELAGLYMSPPFEDHQGSLWAAGRAVADGRLCEIRRGAVRCQQMNGPERAVFAIHEDRKANLWLGTYAGVWRWRPGRPELYSNAQTDGVQAIADAEDRGVLIAARDSIKRLVDGKWEVAFPLPVSVRGPARQILRDRDGAMWVKTAGGGVVHIHGERTDVFSQPDGLTGDIVTSLFEDREGNIWVATTHGLDRFRELPVITYSTDQGMPSVSSAVLAGRDGSIWSTSSGLYRLNRGQVTVYGQRKASARTQVREIRDSGLPDGYSVSLFQDSHGRIWVSSLEGGAGYMENDRFIRASALGGPTTTFAEDSAGSISIAYPNRGLLRLSPGNEVQLLLWDTFGHQGSGYHVSDPVHGGFWLGFRKGGVSYFRDGQVRASYSTADGLADGQTNQVRLDGQNALWVATQGGLSRVKDGRIATLTSKNGLPCDTVLWSLEDDTGSIWMGMPCGVARIARAELESWARALDKSSRAIQTTLFDTTDGARMPGVLGGSSPHADKSPDGRLWFVEDGGLGVIDPRHLPFNRLPPPVHIEKITADRKTYAADANGRLRLPPLVRDVQIDYTGLSFAEPEKMRFRFKLEGRDRDWHEVGNRRQAFYDDLPPRNYRFRVMASNNDGVWNEAGTSLDFSVAPAYYQTTWFLALAVAAILGLLAALYQLRLRYVKHQFDIRMEARVGERTRIARDLHDTLLQSFQGVLLKFSTIKYVMRSRPAEAEEMLERTIEQARAAITEGRNAVQGLRSSVVVANDLARAIGTFGEGLAANHAGADCPEFGVYVEGQSRDLPPLVRDEVYRIGCEAVRNAFQHSNAKRIEAELRYDPRQFRLHVVDNGKGIDLAVLNAGGREGHHGLPGLHERAALAGGKLSVWSRPGSGTEIELTIPGTIAYTKTPAAKTADATETTG